MPKPWKSAALKPGTDAGARTRSARTGRAHHRRWSMNPSPSSQRSPSPNRNPSPMAAQPDDRSRRRTKSRRRRFASWSSRTIPANLHVVHDGPADAGLRRPTPPRQARPESRWRTAGAYDLILLDVKLPDIDGWAVARPPAPVRAGIKSSPSSPSPPAPRPRISQRCFDSGMDDVVTKPFKISTLKTMIVKYARNEGAEEAVAEESS